jgi:excisionase family DNA binding protein
LHSQTQTHNSRTDLDTLASALAERLQLSNSSPWMSTAEAAEYMRVSIRWLRQHLHQIPHSKVEGRLFFSRKELDAWLANNRRSWTGEVPPRQEAGAAPFIQKAANAAASAPRRRDRASRRRARSLRSPPLSSVRQTCSSPMYARPAVTGSAMNGT